MAAVTNTKISLTIVVIMSYSDTRWTVKPFREAIGRDYGR
jgi:hypothetical protein